MEIMVKNLKNEVWGFIPETNESYQISNFGRVKSVCRKIWNGKGYFYSSEKLLTPNILAKGYLQVEMRINKNRKCMLVHRLVAFSFIPNPNPNYTQINHIDGNKQNNCVMNLEWCDNSLNQLHAYKTGLNKRSETAGKPKRAVIKLSKSDDVICRYDSIAQAAIMNNINKKSNITLTCKGERPTCGGYKWKYEDE